MTEASTHKVIVRALLSAVLLAGGAALGYGYARLHGAATATGTPPTTAAPATHAAPPPAERKVLYWYDPMKPDQHFDKSGRSPFMDMDLVPRYAEPVSVAAQAEHGEGVMIDARSSQNLALRSVVARRGRLALAIEAVGELQYNQRDIAAVQTRADGFVERVYGRAPGESIARGAPLADVLLPSWGSAQQEFLSVLALGDLRLLQAARMRLHLLGMSDTLIASIEQHRQPQAVITLVSPLAGVITTLDVRVGMSVTAGSTLAIVNGSDPVWLEVAVPERLASQLRVGAEVSAQLASEAGRQWRGSVAAILPAADSATRSVRVRVSLANADGRLRPGLSARVHIDAPPSDEVVLVPSATIIRGGQQDRVMRVEEGGRYAPVVVELGREANGETEVLHGLEAGDRVAASAQFLLDADASLKGLTPAAPPPTAHAEMTP